MKICIPIREKTLGKVKKQIRKALKHADFIEIWMNEWAGGRGLRVLPEEWTIYLKELIKNSEALPVIAVCRGSEENGDFRGTEQERIEVLKTAIQEGARFVDVGIHTEPKLIKSLKAACRKHHAKLIISAHIWNNTPEVKNLEKLVLRAKKLGGDIVKIATYVRNWSDNVVLFELTARAQKMGQKVIIIGMGEKGKISRLGCPLLGSLLTYVALDEKSRTAPSQLTIDELRTLKLF